MINAQSPLSEGVIDLRKPPTCYVYRAYDQAGELLYVGMADNVHHRLKGHKRDSPWFSSCVTVEWEEYPSRALAARIESELIQGLRPPFNTVHNKETRAQREARLRAMRLDFSPMDRLLR